MKFTRYSPQLNPVIFIKRMALLFVLFIIAGCTTTRPLLGEDSLIITRKYVGNFLDYRIAGEGGPLNPKIFWIKTSLESDYGKIGVYARKQMEFKPYERLYLRRTYFQHMAISSWTYQLESSDQKIFYNIYGTSMDSTRISSIERLFKIP